MNLFGIAVASAEEAVAAGEVSTAGGIVGLLVSMLPMILIFVVMYFMMIRPQRKKDKAVREMLAALKVTDRICTIGGIYGTVAKIQDDLITLKVGKDDTTMVVARWAIRSVEDEKISVENEGELSLN